VESLALLATPKLIEGGSEVERVDDIIKRLAWAAKLYGGSRRNRECDQGSRARDWKIEDHDVVTAENWGA